MIINNFDQTSVFSLPIFKFTARCVRKIDVTKTALIVLSALDSGPNSLKALTSETSQKQEHAVRNAILLCR